LLASCQDFGEHDPVGRRLKQAGARWTIRRGNRMATLCGALHGDTWNPYWDAFLH
jgi:hypothetical protein